MYPGRKKNEIQRGLISWASGFRGGGLSLGGGLNERFREDSKNQTPLSGHLQHDINPTLLLYSNLL